MSELDTNTALAVDDNKRFRSMLPTIIGSGFVTDTAATADEAVDKIRSQEPPYDVVVTDGLDGEYQRVVQAAVDVGSRAVLLTFNEEYIREAAEQDPPTTGLVKGDATIAEIREAIQALIDAGEQDSPFEEV